MTGHRWRSGWPLWSLWRLAALAAPAAFLAACAAPPPSHSFIVLGENGAAVARVITPEGGCPALLLDGRPVPMRERAPAQTVARRPTAAPPDESKASVFSARSCDAIIPPGTRTASAGGRNLPVPAPQFRRIVVIGDTGCRVKKGGGYQDCNHADTYPFARIAAAAANWHPDLVVHVGDYHYRESACPADQAGCAGSPWGYGWDVWNADFFTPGAALLAAAPWVMARGNHETCARAGQGYWRFLDPRPLLENRDCDLPGNDAAGDYSDPYAVPLGDGAQLIVIDTANTNARGLGPGDPAWVHYADAYRKVEALSARAAHNIGVDHHPILGFGASAGAGGITLVPGDRGLQDAFGSVNPGLLPPRVEVMLSGHIHLWEQLSFSSPHPSQFIAGFSGTLEDTVPLPATLPGGFAPAPGAIVANYSAWVGGFGYMTMERVGADRWDVTVWNVDGVAQNRCTVVGSKSSCAKRMVP